MQNNDLKEETLKTLSFLEPMSLEMIFLDFDQAFLEQKKDLTTEDLLNVLLELTKQKKIKQETRDGQKFWIKLYPKKPWYRKLFFIPFK